MPRPFALRFRLPVTPVDRTKVVPNGNPCQIVSPMAEKCRATSWRTAFCHPPEKRFLRGAAHSGVFAVRRLAFFAAFWSAVNRGLRPRKLMYFLTAKSTKNSPADAFAYFVPSNVRNGRLFAGLQANRPRFLPLLAGPSFHGSGIGPGSFAAKGGAGVRRLFYGCLHRTGSQYPAVAPESGFKPLYAFCRAGFSSRDIGKLSTFHF